MNQQGDKVKFAMGFVILILAGALTYLLFLREDPCETRARYLVRAQSGEELTQEEQIKAMTAVYKCRTTFDE